MDNIKILALVVILASLQLYASCSKNDDEYELAELHFEGEFKVYPVKDTVSVGDTIWIEAAIPDSLREINLNRYYKIDRKYLEGLFSLAKLVNPAKTINEQPGNAGTYKTKAEIGELDRVSSSFIRYHLQEEGILNKLKVAFVPQHPGVHTISTLLDHATGGGLLPYIELSHGSSGKRRVVMLRSIHFRFNDSGSGYHIFKQHCFATTVKGEHPFNVYLERIGAYTFVVK